MNPLNINDKEQQRQRELNKGNQILSTIETLKKQINILASDERYAKYAELLKLQEDGQVINEMIQKRQQFMAGKVAELNELRQRSHVVNAALTELEGGIAPKQRRSEEQKIDGHYSDEETVHEPDHEPEVPPQHSRNSVQQPEARQQQQQRQAPHTQQRQVTPKEIEEERDPDLPDLDNISEELGLEELEDEKIEFDSEQND